MLRRPDPAFRRGARRVGVESRYRIGLHAHTRGGGSRGALRRGRRWAERRRGRFRGAHHDAHARKRCTHQNEGEHINGDLAAATGRHRCLLPGGAALLKLLSAAAWTGIVPVCRNCFHNLFKLPAKLTRCRRWLSRHEPFRIPFAVTARVPRRNLPESNRSAD